MQQYQRNVKLVVNNLNTGIDLSQMQFKFVVEQSDIQTPSNLIVRIYNLKFDTARRIQGEFTHILLAVGYGFTDPPRQIFIGTIKQIKRGRENPTDTFVDIIASDGDMAYNQATVNKSLAAGSTWADVRNVIGQSMKAQGDVNSVLAPGVAVGPPYIRGKVLYGLARDMARKLSDTMDTTWYIDNGTLVFATRTGYLPNEAVVLTSKTGLIGMPEQTPNGIRVRCLLNPGIKMGTLISLDNRSIQAQRIDVAYTAINRIADISSDGVYKALSIDHFGNTRGQEWYSDIICLAADRSAAAAQAVKPYLARDADTKDRN